MANGPIFEAEVGERNEKKRIERTQNFDLNKQQCVLIMAELCCLELLGERDGWWGAEWQTNRREQHLGPVISCLGFKLAYMG
jgi:hypothetical protein